MLSGVRYIAQSLFHLIFAYLFSVTNPLTPSLYCIHDENINILNDFILLSRGNVSQMTAEKNERGEGLFKRRAQVSTNYQGVSACTLEAAASAQQSAAEEAGSRAAVGSLKDILLGRLCAGTRASVFTDHLLQLQTSLKLHGFTHAPDSVRECKVMVLHHLLNGDCMRYAHLCHNTEGAARPDRTACQVLRRGFCDPQDFVEAIVSIATTAKATDLSTDNLLLMVESTGQTQLVRPRENLRRKLIQNLINHCTHTRHRSTMHTPAFDVFHDLLNNFEQCNSATLMSVMGRHRISAPSHKKLTREDMKQAILTHILDGDCIMKSTGLPQIHAENAQASHVGCEDVQRTIDPASVLPDQEMKIALLEALKNELPRLPMLRLFKIEKIDHNPQDSLKTLHRKLQEHIDSLKSSGNTPQVHGISDPQAPIAPWPHKIPQSLKDKVASLFLEDTSSVKLKMFTCTSCGEACLTSNRINVASKDISLIPLHRPDRRPKLKDPETVIDEDWLTSISNIPPIHQNMFDPEALLDPRGVEMHKEDSCAMLSFCSECHASILKSKTPALALANHMFLGDVPPELKDLTMIEEAMIAKCRAKSWVVQLQAKNDSTCLPNSQRGLKGHTIIYPQQPQGLTRILPPSVAEICTPICVIFVGAHKPSNEWLKTRAKPLIVRRERVRKALEWLHLHNPLYADIEIDYPTLDTFPENDVLPYHIEHLQPENTENADVLTSRYENPEGDCGPEDQQEAEFENVVVTDVDGSASSNQLRAAAMRHVKEKGGGYIEVPHDSKPVNEFFNPALFPMIYPTLYPHGLGGFEDSCREVRVSLKRHVKHLFNLQDKRFQEHYSFMFTVFNILQRRAILLHTSLKVKAQNFDSVAATLNAISADTIRIVCDRVAHGDAKSYQNEDERRVLQLLKEVNVVVSNVAGSSASRVVMRNEIRAMIVEKGLPSFYLTINPADVFNPVVKFLAGSEIDVDRLLPEQVPSYLEQSILVAKNPFVASKFFNLYMKSFVKNILGHDPRNQDNEGILGTVSGYYGCVEAQGRGTLHCHMLVWLDGALNCEEIRDKVQANDVDFQRRLVEFLDDTISNEIPPMPDIKQNVPSSVHNPCAIRGLNSEEFQNLKAAKEEDLHNLVRNC